MEKGKNSYKVCLMGASLETGNMGVSALAVSLIKNIREIRPDADISFLIGNRTSLIRNPVISGEQVQIKVINYRLSPKAKIQEHLFWIFFMACLQRIVLFKSIREKIILSNPWLKALNQADFVGDIHGGDSFSDIYGLNGIVIGVLPDIITILMKKKLVLLPQTYGPYDHNVAKCIARFIMNHAYKILSRDKEGLEIVKKILYKRVIRNNTDFCPDVAFTLDADDVMNPELAKFKRKNPNVPLIGFNINGLMYNGGYTRDNMFGLKCDYKSFVNKFAERFLAETPAHLLLVPHTFGPSGNINSDPDACRDVFESLENSFNDRVHLITGEYDQSEIKGVIKSCDFFVGSRMHACIAALSQGIPTVGIAYSRKFIGVFESIGARNMIADARKLDSEVIIHKILNSFSDRVEIKEKLGRKIDDAKNQIRRTFKEILMTGQ